jgi:lipopolysaccharide assembly outer membrane protein LptD (OstA)
MNIVLASRLLAAGLFAAMLACEGGALAQETKDAKQAPPPANEGSEPKPAQAGPPARARFPEGLDVEFTRLTQPGPDEYVMEGAVTLRSGHSRIQADRVHLRGKRYVEAEGNVLIVWETNRISGRRMTYDLEAERGMIEDAIGQVDPEFYFTAKQVEKVGDDWVYLETATVTTCTQPLPYWSFAVSSAKIHLDHYAHMVNLRLKIKKAPVFYLPYMIWPVKSDRAAGLLFPTFGSNAQRGTIIGDALYIPIGRSVDLTLGAEYYTSAGLGWGGELLFLPNSAGHGSLSGFFISDKVSDSNRYRVTYKQTQQFRNGFRVVADINQISDFNFFNDYEQELKLASSPTILARVEATRNGAWTSLNVRELRREQLFFGGSTLVQWTLPEIEFRGRSRKLGKSPFYLSFESSAALIRQDGQQPRFVYDPDDPAAGGITVDFPLNSNYERLFGFPTISLPISPVPWLEITPSVAYRAAYYTQRQVAVTRYVPFNGNAIPVAIQEIVEDPLYRGAFGAGVEIVGPKLYRIYRTGAEATPRYRHSIEPFISYGYQQAASATNEILLYDELDQYPSASNQAAYGIRTRLIAQRPRSKLLETDGGQEKVLMPGSATGRAAGRTEPTPDTAPAPDEAGRPPKLEPVEIASLEIRQRRAFDRDLETEDLNGDGILQPAEDFNGDGVLQHSRTSPLELGGRYSPSTTTGLDLRMTYDTLFGELTQVSLSGHYQGGYARGGFSLVRSSSVQTDAIQAQLRLVAGTTLIGGRLRLDVEGSYDAQLRQITNQRWRTEIYTQCCGFLAEYLVRDFPSSSPQNVSAAAFIPALFTPTNRREFRFTIDLRGIGKLLSLQQGSSQ